jgi:hypothetical protein
MEPIDGGGDSGEETMLQADPGGRSAEEWYAAIGELVIAFERVCDWCRLYIGAALPGREPDDWDRKAAVMCHLGADQLRRTVAALYERGGLLDTSREKRVGQAQRLQKALKDFEELIKLRNRIVHSDWSFFPINDQDPDAEINATDIVALMPNRSQKGPAWEERRFTFQQVQDAIHLACDVRRNLFTIGAIAGAAMQRQGVTAPSKGAPRAKPPRRP